MVFAETARALAKRRPGNGREGHEQRQEDRKSDCGHPRNA